MNAKDVERAFFAWMLERGPMAIKAMQLCKGLTEKQCELVPIGFAAGFIAARQAGTVDLLRDIKLGTAQ